MSYRKSAEALEWRKFQKSHRQLIVAAELPDEICESKSRFEDFLMHGHLDHHPSRTEFSIDQLDAVALNELKRLVVEYIRSYGDPGLMLFSLEVPKSLIAEACST
ncbi:MAG: hypothetical protein AAFX44_18135 [Pseudomonadota bacterium]